MNSGESTAQSGPSVEPRKREMNSRLATARINSRCRQARVKGSTISAGIVTVVRIWSSQAIEAA